MTSPNHKRLSAMNLIQICCRQLCLNFPMFCFAGPHQAEFEVRGQGVQASVRNSYRFFIAAYRLFPLRTTKCFLREGEMSAPKIRIQNAEDSSFYRISSYAAAIEGLLPLYVRVLVHKMIGSNELRN
jgi:hypothetical protein